jgi:hypothetical protein
MIDRTIRVPGNFGHFAVFEVNQDAAATMTHPAMAFDHGVISVDFHFPCSVGIFEFRHDVPPWKLVGSPGVKGSLAIKSRTSNQAALDSFDLPRQSQFFFCFLQRLEFLSGHTHKALIDAHPFRERPGAGTRDLSVLAGGDCGARAGLSPFVAPGIAG